VLKGWFVDNNDNNDNKQSKGGGVYRITYGKLPAGESQACPARALRWEDEREREEEDCIDVWLADCASYLNRPLHAIIIGFHLSSYTVR
jgi:hypothetical protein